MKLGDMAPAPQPQRSSARLRIEDAAQKLFAQQPFHRVGLDDIATEAHASLQTIYRHYGSKEAILEACVHRWARELATRMLDHLQGIETYKDRLRKVFWVVLDYFDRNTEVARMIQNTVSVEAVGRDITDEQRMLTGLFMQVLREGREQGVLTDEVGEEVLLDIFYGMLIRRVQMQLVRQNPKPMAATANAQFELLWRALAKPADAGTQ